MIFFSLTLKTVWKYSCGCSWCKRDTLELSLPLQIVKGGYSCSSMGIWISLGREVSPMWSTVISKLILPISRAVHPHHLGSWDEFCWGNLWTSASPQSIFLPHTHTHAIICVKISLYSYSSFFETLPQNNPFLPIKFQLQLPFWDSYSLICFSPCKIILPYTPLLHLGPTVIKYPPLPCFLGCSLSDVSLVLILH